MDNTYFNREKNEGMVGGRYTRDYNDYLKMGGPSLDAPSSSYSGAGAGYTPPNYAQIAQDQLKFQEEANRPSIQAFEAQKPLIQQSYQTLATQKEGEKEPLKQRYQSILDELSQREQRETGGERSRLATEYSRRGIPLSSGDYERATSQAVNPISQYYGGQRANTQLTQEDALRELTNQIQMIPITSLQEQNLVDQAIGQLRAGFGKTAAENALGLYQTDVQGREAAAKRAQDLRVAQMEADIKRQANALSQRELEQYKIPSLEVERLKANKPDSSAGGYGAATLALLAGNQNQNQGRPWMDSKGNQWSRTDKVPIGKDPKTGQTIYSDGTKGWTQWF